jgi:hypothetical protein
MNPNRDEDGPGLIGHHRQSMDCSPIKYLHEPDPETRHARYCPDRYNCLGRALLELKGKIDPERALIFIARFYFGLKVEELGKIFAKSFTTCSRIAKDVENKLIPR